MGISSDFLHYHHYITLTSIESAQCRLGAITDRVAKKVPASSNASGAKMQ